jgi:threonine dehydrogenase-like Zn-dependent dehydrogenase
VIPEWMDDEDALLCTDVLATGYFGAQLGDIIEGDTVVVFGAGPVGLYAAKSSWLMGAGRVIVVDHLEYRLEKARHFAHAETINFRDCDDVVVEMKKQTDHLGADVAIDAVGAEAAGMEDARFVRFVDDDGSATFYATYTAYSGSHISQQLLESAANLVGRGRWRRRW